MRPALIAAIATANVLLAIPSAGGAAIAKPTAPRCSAAATVDANAMEYQIAELEGRLTPPERARWTAAKLAEFERDLAALRPKAAVARAVADKLVNEDTPDALFDEVEALSGAEREALIARCHSAYLR